MATALPTFAQQGDVSVSLVTTFDYPNALQTEPQAISHNGQIAGIILDAAGTYSFS